MSGAAKQTRDRAFEAWLERGRAVRVVHELQRRGHWARIRRSGAELVGPCPFCGGRDRFSVHPGKDLWNCRKCGAGGDAIALVRHVDGLGFLAAVELVTGEPAPGAVAEESEADRLARRERQGAAVAKASADEARREREQAEYRTRERRRAYEIWRNGMAIAGTPAERYLQLRGVSVPRGARLRYRADHALWDAPPPDGTVIHRGPAMLAAIEGPDGTFAACQAIWIDLQAPNGKAMVPDPKSGEFLAAKKVRGSKRGGSILLARPPNSAAPQVLFLGEGIETVLSVREALAAAQADVLDLAEFRAAVDLDNLSGKAAGQLPHPTETFVDKTGRVRRRMVPDAVPSPKDRAAVIAIPGTVTDLILLGDGDSEPFRTRLALERAAARFAAAYPWLTIRLAMAPEGLDFNDAWRAGLRDAPAPFAEAAPDLCEAS